MSKVIKRLMLGGLLALAVVFPLNSMAGDTLQRAKPAGSSLQPFEPALAGSGMSMPPIAWGASPKRQNRFQ